MADLDPALMQKIFDIPERKREPNVEHDCQADDFGAGFEIAKWTAFCHPAKLGCRPARLKPVSSDRTSWFSLTRPFYNPKRKHTNNGMLSPVDFENRQQKLNEAGT